MTWGWAGLWLDEEELMEPSSSPPSQPLLAVLDHPLLKDRGSLLTRFLALPLLMQLLETH